MAKRTLEEIANEYVTQSNLSTRHPIGYIVTETMDIASIDDDGEHITIYTDGDYLNFDSFEEVKQYVMERDEVDPAEFEEYFEENDYSIYRKAFFKDYFPDSYAYTYNKERINKGKQFFLTKTSVEEHIISNRHHYDNPQWLLIYAGYRNPDMLTFMNTLYAAATVPREQWNQEARRYYEKEVLNK